MRTSEFSANEELAWAALPRGSERATLGSATLDAWLIGGGARYTVLGADGRYIAGGHGVTLDHAKQRAVAALAEAQA
jgi:hypothetical protein